MSKKIIFLIVCLFLLSGCDITYNLEISKDTYTENATIIEDNISLFYSDEIEKQFYNNYINVPIPMTKYVPIPTNFNGEGSFETREKGYYEAKKLTNDTRFGMEYKGVFDSSNIADSRLINEASPDAIFKVDDKNIVISANNLEREFKQISVLDEIIVNITVKDYLVTRHNADKRVNNTYTWNITRDNYTDKSIELKIDKSNEDKQFINQILNMIKKNEIIIIIMVVITLFIIVYFFVKRVERERNMF